MEMNMNLVREILMWAENQEHGSFQSNPEIEGYSKEEVGYHVYLMNGNGMAEALVDTTLADKSPQATLLRLTWKGHEFIAIAKNKTIWAKAVSTVLAPGLAMGLDLFFEWLKAEAKKSFGME